MSPAWPELHFHGVHAAQDNDNGQDGIGVLMEDRILKVMIVERDEDRQAGQGDGQEDPEADRSRVGE